MARVAARKVGSITQLRDSLAKGGAWIINSVPKDDSLVVRFLTEPEDWAGYEEVWDSGLRKFYPAVEGMDREGLSISERYLACVLDVANGKVIALKLPRDLANRLVNRYTKYGTVMDRDYELSRYGEGFDTTYEVTPEAPTKRKLDKYEILDLEDVLQRAYEAVHGGTDDDEEDKPSPRRAAKAAATPRKSRPAPEPEDDDEDEDEEDLDEEEFEEEDEWEDDEDEEWDDEEEPVDDEEESDDEEEIEGYTEEELEEMALPDLREVAREFGITPTRMKKAELIEAIMEEQPF